jgi:hypothetical protein
MRGSSDTPARDWRRIRLPLLIVAAVVALARARSLPWSPIPNGRQAAAFFPCQSNHLGGGPLL